MKIRHLTIDNYRILKHLDIDCESGMNVFIGINGAGKSTILHAIRLLLSWFTSRMQSKSGRGSLLTDKDITNGAEFCRLEIVLDNGVRWMLYKRRSDIRKQSTDKSDLWDMNHYISKLYESYSIESGTLSFVPIIAYYGVDRAVTDVPSYVGTKHLINPIDVYKGFGDEKINFRSFFEWFKEREDLENEKYRENSSSFIPDRQLEAVRTAIEGVLPGYGNLRIRRNPRAILIDKNGKKFNFEQLSDGEKCYITLIGDIARKIAMANPKSSNPLEEPGIVVIDEIDLHLHPSWQQNVIGNISNAFKNVQFVITTHSPFIISSTKQSSNNQIVVLDNGNSNKVNDDLYGSRVEDVLLKIFGLQTVRNAEVQKKIDKIWTLLDSHTYNKQAVENEVKWLHDNIDPSDIEFARIALQERLIQKQEDGK